MEMQCMHATTYGYGEREEGGYKGCLASSPDVGRLGRRREGGSERGREGEREREPEQTRRSDQF